MITPLKQMLEYAYNRGKYRLAASIAMLSELGWYEENLPQSDMVIMKQAKTLINTKKLTSKARTSTITTHEVQPIEPQTLPEVVAEVVKQPKPKTTQCKPFIKPTVEQVEAYCRERNNGVNAHQFVDFYEAKGWLIGKNPMKDWRAAVRTWEQRDGRGQKQLTKRGATPAPAETIKLW